MEWSLGSLVSDEDVLDKTVVGLLTLEFHTFRVYMALFVGTDMWVNDGDESTSSIMDSLVHVHDLLLAELCVVEFSVLLLLGILNIEPENIDWESVSAEIMVTLDHLVSISILVLGEVVSERVNRWHRGISSQL